MPLRIPTMTPRAWQPAVCDESPVRAGEQKQDRAKFEGGTHAEPGDQQKVRVLTRHWHHGLTWSTARYDRTMCCFWTRTKWNKISGWLQITRKVLAWTQYPLGDEMADPDVRVAA